MINRFSVNVPNPLRDREIEESAATARRVLYASRMVPRLNSLIPGWASRPAEPTYLDASGTDLLNSSKAELEVPQTDPVKEEPSPEK